MNKQLLAGIGIFIGFTLLLSAVAVAGLRAFSGSDQGLSTGFIAFIMFIGSIIGLPSVIAFKYYKAKPKDGYDELKTLAAAQKSQSISGQKKQP